MTARMIFHDTDRGRFFARHWGDESLPVLLMLHGFPEFSGAWAALAQRLCHRFHCIAPDQRGFGQTGGPDDIAAYTTRNLVADMRALIGDRPVAVLGHDWGAAVAYGLAMFAPDVVDRLIILNGVHPVPFQRALAAGSAQAAASQYILRLRAPGAEDWLAQNDFEKLFKLFSADMSLGWLTPKLRAAYHQEWARPGRLKTMLHWYRASPLIVPGPGQTAVIPDLDRVQLRVPQPHLLIWGAEDTALLPEATRGLEDFAPDLTRITLPGADHWLAHQQPDLIAREILAWCG